MYFDHFHQRVKVSNCDMSMYPMGVSHHDVALSRIPSVYLIVILLPSIPSVYLIVCKGRRTIPLRYLIVNCHIDVSHYGIPWDVCHGGMSW